MSNCKIKDGKIYLDSKSLCELWDVKPPTITAYKKKGLESVVFSGEKTQYFELKNAEEVKVLRVKDKHSQSKTGLGKDDGSDSDAVMFPDGRRFYEMDIDNPEDLELVALHPLGEMYLDRIDTAAGIKKKHHDLKVKKGQYILMEELNKSLAETFALVLSYMVLLRDQLPISQVDKIIQSKIIKTSEKQEVVKIISDEADKYADEMTKDIDEAMMKRTPKTTKATVSFLEKLIENVKK